MEEVLCHNYPKKFVFRGKKTKLLKLALEVYTDSILGKKPGSNTEYATRLGWKGCQGKISGMFKKLEKLGLTRGKKFNEGFLSELYYKSLVNVKYSKEILEGTKSLLSPYCSKNLDPNAAAGQGFKLDAGQLMSALLLLFEKATKGEEAYLLLREGSTWGSPGVGDFMRFILERAVTRKGIRLRVITTSYMNEKLIGFFEDLGQIIVNDAIGDFLGNLRFFYISGYVITVVKTDFNVAGEIFSGTIRKDSFNEKGKVREMFESAVGKVLSASKQIAV